MKITDIKTFPIQAGRDMFVVKVETDEGIYGLGEGGCSSRELAEEAVVQHFSRFLIGMDPIMWDPFRYKLGGRLLNGEMEEFTQNYGTAEDGK